MPLTWGAGGGASHYQIREIDTLRQLTRIIDIAGTGTQTSVTSVSPGNEPAEFPMRCALNAASAGRGTVSLCVGTSGLAVA